MDLFSHRKIENGVIKNVSDSSSPINKYITQYIEQLGVNNKPRLLEYEAKEDKVDFPPFMKARVIDYWASS